MARPTKLSAEVQEQIVKAVRDGATRRDAAHSAGIAYETLRRWLAAGRAGGRFYEFCVAVERAEAELRVELAASIVRAAADDWRPAIEYLKRRDPANWGDRLQVSKMTDDELLRLLKLADDA